MDTLRLTTVARLSKPVLAVILLKATAAQVKSVELRWPFC